MLENGVYKVKYVLPSGVVTEPVGEVCEYREDGWYHEWLDNMVKMSPEFIFFLVVETTDVFED